MKLMKRKPPEAQVLVRGVDHVGLVDEALTREVIGGFYKVYNIMGHGFLESVYSKAFYIELRRRGLRVKREVTVTAFYEQYPVGHFRVDLLVEDRLAVELKAGAYNRARRPTTTSELASGQQPYVRPSLPLRSQASVLSPDLREEASPRSGRFRGISFIAVPEQRLAAGMMPVPGPGRLLGAEKRLDAYRDAIRIRQHCIQ